MSGIIVSAEKGLPRDIDVTVSVSKPQTELTTDLSVPVFCSTSPTFPPDANRIRYYSTLEAVADDGFTSSSEVYKAATAFFSQSPRAKTMAVARIFDAATAGYLVLGSVLQTVATWKAVTNGSFRVSVDGTVKDITAIDFSAITDIDDVASTIQTKLAAAAAGCTVVNKGSGVFWIVSGTTGNSSTISYLSAVSPGSGTDISGTGFLNGNYVDGQETQTAYSIIGYLPTGLADELALISEAATCAGKFVYAYVLDREWRDDSDVIDAAIWMEARGMGTLALCTNSPFAYDPSSTTDIGYLVKTAGYVRTFVTYHNNSFYYPDMAIIARALSVNYAASNSTITTKFKDLIGIPTVPMTETELAVLETKRINTFTLVGNNSRTFREGTQAHPSWFIDDLINLDNFKEELQVAVYNVFLQNKKVPYTVNGINLLETAMDQVCRRYVDNGTFADRPIDNGEYNKPAIDPAYAITFASIASMTASDRARRKGPPATIKANLAGAIHSIDISVEAYA